MIEDDDNNYDLEHITVASPPEAFAVGKTLRGRSSFRWWWVHWRDLTTLMIAPFDDPSAAYPAHIYRCGWNGT